MSDARLHQLERAWAESGAEGDAARYLHERVRQGDLTFERLELAAYCGHEAARRVAGKVAVPPSFNAQIEGLERWGRAVMVRAAHAALAPSLYGPGEDTPEARAVCSVENWLREVPGATLGVLESWRALHDEYHSLDLTAPAPPALRSADAVSCVCRAVIGQGWVRSTVQAFRHLADPFAGWETAQGALRLWALGSR